MSTKQEVAEQVADTALADLSKEIERLIEGVATGELERLGNSAYEFLEAKNYFDNLEVETGYAQAKSDYTAAHAAYKSAQKAYAKAHAGLTSKEVKAALANGDLAAANAAAYKKLKFTRTEELKNALFNVYHVCEHFQNDVQACLGQSLKMAFMVEGQELALIDITSLTMQQKYHIDYDSHTGAMILRYNTPAKLKKLVEAKESKENINLHFQMSELNLIQSLYSEVKSRIAIANSKNSPYLMWQIGQEWNKVLIDKNWGDIMEAFANMVINFDADSQIQLSSMTYDEGIDFLINHYLTQVDNASGFLQEDVKQTNAEIDTFIGIKSKGASILKLSPVTKLAEALVNARGSGRGFSKTINIEDIAQGFMADSGGDVRNPIIKKIIEKLDSAEQDILSTNGFKTGKIGT